MLVNYKKIFLKGSLLFSVGGDAVKKIYLTTLINRAKIRCSDDFSIFMTENDDKKYKISIIFTQFGKIEKKSKNEE